MANRIWQITHFVEQRRLGFGVARLLMMTGVRLRDFQEDSPESPEEEERVLRELPKVLSASEMEELEQILHGGQR